MSTVSVQNLSVRLGGNEILAGLDLDVDASEFLVLLGPSGCGKSTLLHSIAGLIDVSDGSIVIGGEDRTWADPSERNIGMVFQSYALYPTMTVERNMSFGLRVNGTPKAEIARRIDRAAGILHLEPLLQRKPSELSGGQRQRVAIGRALVREAAVFLFDEPLSNLDAKLRGELRRELKLLHQKLRSTMIYVTHDQVEAMTLATRIVVMKAGKIQQIGAPEEVYERPANLFVAGFLGAPGMNVLRGQLALDGAGLRFVTPALSLGVDSYRWRGPATGQHGQAVVLGVRPEHVLLAQSGAFAGTVTLVEPMGNHQVVWVEAGGWSISALVHEARQFAAGENVRFDLDVAHLSLFDENSEQRL
jgi:multiple sugar transport system ATP-binding protein